MLENVGEDHQAKIEEFFERGPTIPHPASAYKCGLWKGKIVPVLN
jgi:hypothetical protein